MIATLHSAAKSPLKVRIALRTGIGWILNKGNEVDVDTKPGRRVSLVPMEEVRGAMLQGVKWPLQGAELHPSGLTAISNISTESNVKASIQSGAAFLFVGFPEEEMPVW
jgi:thiamine pyrophosphokinase